MKKHDIAFILILPNRGVYQYYKTWMHQQLPHWQDLEQLTQCNNWPIRTNEPLGYVAQYDKCTNDLWSVNSCMKKPFRCPMDGWALLNLT